MTPSLGMTTAPGDFLAPFVPSPEALVDCMLDAARVGPGDTVYDLGAGDGRIVVAAAQRFGARAVGVELDDTRFALSSARIRDFGLEPRARIVHGDLLSTDLRPATVVTLYQLPAVNEMLRPTLEYQLRSGARVVTLDFPVQGWEASKVLTVQLTDGSKHAIYLYLISEIRKETSSMANSETLYNWGHCWLELQGTMAGLLKYAEGGDATADVVIEKLGTDLIARKHIGQPKYEDIIVSFGTGMSSSLYDWIDAAMRRVPQGVDGAVVMVSRDYKNGSRLNFYRAMISEIGFPSLDASSGEPANFTLEIAPEFTTREAKSGPPPAGGWAGWEVASKSAMLLSRNFRLRIDGLDCTRVSRIESLRIAQRFTPGEVGDIRSYEKQAYLEIPNLVITLSEIGSETFRQWHEDFVIKGNSGSNMERNGTLEYLDANLKGVVFTLTFRNLGIFKLAPEKYDAGGESIRRLRAEMYCQEIGFQYGTSAVSGKGAVVETATVSVAGPTTAPPPYSGTPVVSPVYVQPFTADAALKAEKLAPSADLVAAPLRLGRPLKFRS